MTRRPNDHYPRPGSISHTYFVRTFPASWQILQRRRGRKHEMSYPQSGDEAKQDEANHIVSIEARHGYNMARQPFG
jgi:hypothetical protein